MLNIFNYPWHFVTSWSNQGINSGGYILRIKYYMTFPLLYRKPIRVLFLEFYVSHVVKAICADESAYNTSLTDVHGSRA